MMIIMPWGMDMSFPAATLVVSNSVDKAHQGTAASLVNTIVRHLVSQYQVCPIDKVFCRSTIASPSVLDLQVQ
jgi:hypothetical protein